MWILGLILVMGAFIWGSAAYAIDFKAVDKEGHVNNLKGRFDDPLVNGKKGEMKIYK